MESSAIINSRGVSTKLYFNLIFTMQSYKELKDIISLRHLQYIRYTQVKLNNKHTVGSDLKPLEF